MKNRLKKAAGALLSEAGQDECSLAEKALKDWGINYEKKQDGTLFVPGDLNISNKGLTQLPDLTSVSVGGNFWCGSNRLTSLEHAPQSVGGGFYCDNNQLTSLEYAPATVGGDFHCYNNRLTSLEHAPQSIGGDFYCYHNRLTSLEGAPQKFKKLNSDLGEFTSWNDVPEELRISPETKARIEQERERSFTHGATVLQQRMNIRRPLQLKKSAALL